MKEQIEKGLIAPPTKCGEVEGVAGVDSIANKVRSVRQDSDEDLFSEERRAKYLIDLKNPTSFNADEGLFSGNSS